MYKFILHYNYLIIIDFKTLRDQAQEIGDLSDSAIRRKCSNFLRNLNQSKLKSLTQVFSARDPIN